MKNSYRNVIRLVCVLASFPVAGNIHALEPIPSLYQEPGLSPNRATVNQSMNEHIDPFTGKLQMHYTDLFIPGNGDLDITVQRSYNSQDELLKEPTALGVGWTMHYGRVLRNALTSICATNVLATKAPVLELPDGSRQILYLTFDLSYTITTSRWKAECAGLGLIVRSPDGTVYEMTTPGQPAGNGPNPQNAYYTTRIVDRNGNTLNFSYVDVGTTTAISRITASDGRTITFSYIGNTLDRISDGSRTWRYSYDTSAGASYPFLTKVTRPDGASWKYSYNMADTGAAGLYSMNQVTYPTGGTIRYAYGFTQFNISLPRTTVVSTKVGVGGNWIYSYNPATKLADIDLINNNFVYSEDEMMDRTYVIGPDGVQTYMHIGANSITSGGVYGIGLLLYKSLDSGFENEYHSWTAQKISNTTNLRPGAYLTRDIGIYAPLQSTTVIVRNGLAHIKDYDNYDPYGNPQSITETGTDTRTTNIAYASFPGKWLLGLPSSQAVNTIGTTAWTYDGNGNRLTEKKYGVETKFTYTAVGDIATKEDARGNLISYSNYTRGIPRGETHPEGVLISRTVDTHGNILSETDGVGATTQYAYDGLNRLTRIVHPVGSPVDISWSIFERKVKRGSYVETTKFDGYGRTSKVTLDGGSSGPITQTFAYDALNRNIFASYPNQSVGTFTDYDALGRVYAVYHVAKPNGVYTGGSRSSYFAFNKVRNTNERGLVHEMAYRSYGSPDGMELLQVTAPDPSASVQMTLNGLGQPLTIDQAGLTRTNVYDTRYYMTSATNPETGTTLYGRDAVGNMISKQVGASSVTNYVYDGRNRQTSIQYPAGTPSVTKVYNKDDTLSSVDNGLVQRQYTYLLNKKLDFESLTVDGKTFSADYAYDGNDALSSLTYSTGLTLTYSPDGLGRPTQAMPFATAVSFHPNGLPQQIRYGNGVASSFAINARLWPSSMSTLKPGGASMIDLAYTYDPSGNVTNIAESVAGLQNRNFGYDNIDRLTSVDMPSAGVTGGTISYDGRGNIISKQLGASFALGYQYDASNKLAAVSGSRNMSFTYDVYGNVSGNSRNQFNYDDAMNMRCADCGTPNEINYVYDGAGTRVKQQTPALTTYFMYGSGGDLLFEVESTGVKREYGYVAGRNIAKKEGN